MVAPSKIVPLQSQLKMLHAISPLDGRYEIALQPLQRYFSECALIRYRLSIELSYLAELVRTGVITHPRPGEMADVLRRIADQFDGEVASEIKSIETKTNHDVKALEYYLKARLTKEGFGELAEFVHFALTSQDINNTAVPMLLRDYTEQELVPGLERLLKKLESDAETWWHVAMLARTHGQPASPTTMGKEIMVFAERLSIQIAELKRMRFSGKFGGATGNFNAHCAAFPSIDWPKWADAFLSNQLGLQRQQHTTQIAHYDEIAGWCHLLVRVSTILLDLCRDLWAYISMEYFGQRTLPGEVGSSTMPHKVNPIDFENAEGNLGMCIAVAEHLARKLPVSRLQRDLSDSTALRNIGVPAAHLHLALQSIKKGLGKLVLNQQAIEGELRDQWILLAEPIQTILRREGYPEPYELLKDLTRGKAALDKESLHAFIRQLDVTERVKQELLALRPDNYLGVLRN
jgi:adenylosuccinate lyase